MSAKDSFEFRGKTKFTILIAALGTMLTTGAIIKTLCYQVQVLQSEVKELRAKSEEVSKALPRIEANLEFTKSTLAEIKEDLKKGKK